MPKPKRMMQKYIQPHMAFLPVLSIIQCKQQWRSHIRFPQRPSVSATLFRRLNAVLQAIWIKRSLESFHLQTNHHVLSKTLWREILKISSIFFMFTYVFQWNLELHHSVAKGLDAYFVILNISGYNIYRSKYAPIYVTNGPYCKSLKTS